MTAPDVSVIVPSRGRAGRLPALLDALGAQTLDRERYEVIVVHSYDDDELPDAEGVRFVRLAPVATGDAARRRNEGWRAARAPLVAFTDDDCRPAPGWLDALMRTASENPGAIVQGATRPDSRDAASLRAALVRTVDQEPPHWYAQTANILYPRALLERVGGLDERIDAGEDIDLAARAQATGARLVAAPEALVHHEARAMSAAGMIRDNRRWGSLVLVTKLNPELRRNMPLRIFWKLEHPYALLAATGVLGARKRPALLALAAPYVALQRNRHGTGMGDRLRAIGQMPVRCVVDLAEVGTFACGSVRYRTLVL